MSSPAATLEPPRMLPVPDSGDCDFSKPAPIDLYRDTLLDTMRQEWEAIARYRITLSRDGDWNDRTVVAEWLPYGDAIQFRDELNAALYARQGGIRRWAQASYGIALHTPAIQRENRAAVGDLVLHEQVVPYGHFNLSGTYIVRQFLLPAVVTAVAANGRILAYRDRVGEHIRAPRNPYVVSQSAVDVQGALAHIAVAEAERGPWAGEFGDLRAIQPILVRYQRIQAPVAFVATDYC